MVNPFICGSFNSKDEDDFEALMNPCSTPKRSKRMLSRTRSSNSKNPYADRGLEKFSALLADLEDKKQKIYSQNSPNDISIVRFVFSPHSNDVKPIVVKLKGKKQPTNDAENKKIYEKTTDEGKELEMESKRRLKKSISGKLKLENLRKPWFYLPLTIILILVFLAIYGRSFAIMCTSIGWYLIPRITETSSSRKLKRKEFIRKYSEKNIVNEGSTSPTSVMNGPVDNKLPAAKHEHRKSW